MTPTIRKMTHAALVSDLDAPDEEETHEEQVGRHMLAGLSALLAAEGVAPGPEPRSPVPWLVRCYSDERPDVEDGNRNTVAPSVATEPDAYTIAHRVTHWPALIAEVAALRAKLADTEEKLGIAQRNYELEALAFYTFREALIGPLVSLNVQDPPALLDEVLEALAERDQLKAKLAVVEAERDALQRHYDAAAPEHNLLALLDLYFDRQQEAKAERDAERSRRERAEAEVERRPEVLAAIERWPTLLPFMLAMAERLDANAHKGGWRDETWQWLRDRLREESNELGAACCWPTGQPTTNAYRARIRREAADVANFAMMIADVRDALAALDHEPGETR